MWHFFGWGDGVGLRGGFGEVGWGVEVLVGGGCLVGICEMGGKA